jgi:outer membrane protein TolC
LFKQLFKMKKIALFLLNFCTFWLGAFSAFPAAAQDTLTLKSAWQAAQTHYPLGGQRAVLGKISALTVANHQANRWLPQLSVNGQATWQSEVTQLPLEIPNVAISSLSKDQYKLTLDANYPLYDGNQLALQRDLERAGTQVEQQRVAVELYRVKDQVNGLFLNALLVDENIHLTQTNLSELQNRMDRLTASVRYGTMSQMNLDELKADHVRAQQRQAELTATRRGLRDQLALLTTLPISDSTRLYLDAPAPAPETLSLARPELALYEARHNLADAHKRLISSKWQPRLSLFAQPGIGRPGLNFLDNTFRSFFIGGLRLNWNLSPTYTLGRERQIQDLKARQVALEQATFEKNLSLQLRAQRAEIERLETMLEKDQELVDLRSKVRASAQVQFDNQIIAARDYTTELNAETQARLDQKVHELQLALARIQYQTLMGH